MPPLKDKLSKCELAALFTPAEFAQLRRDVQYGRISAPIGVERIEWPRCMCGAPLIEQIRCFDLPDGGYICPNCDSRYEKKG